MLHHHIPYVPDVKSDNIQMTLHIMQEFLQNEATGKPEHVPDPGTYFRHQNYTALMFTIQDFLMLVHKQGTGKSCAQVASALEVLKRSKLYTKVLMATTPSLTVSLEQQFLCKCTDGSYLHRVFNSSKQLEEKPTPDFKKVFSIKTHNELFQMLCRKNGNRYEGITYDEMREKFNGYIIQIDEFSELILTRFTDSNRESTTRYSLAPKLMDLKRVVDERDHNDPYLIDDLRIKDSDLLYIQVWRLSKCKNINLKFMGLTGTPIVNHPSEFFLLANIILPIDQQYDVEYYANRVFELTIEDFSRMNGLISYVDTSASVAKPSYQGKILDFKHVIENREPIPSRIKLKYVEIFAFQAEGTIGVMDMPNQEIKNQQYYCFCGYDLSTGINARFITGNEEEQTEEQFIPIDPNNAPVNLSDAHSRMKTSGLFSRIVEREWKKFLTGDPGFTYIYCKRTDTGYPAFKRIFEIFGFEVLSGGKFNLTKRSKTGYCGEGSVTIENLERSGEIRKPRVIFVDGHDSLEVREQILKVCSSKANVRGKIVQVLVASDIFKMGVNIGNVEEMDRICGEWNESAESQSRDRIFREDSHNYYREYLSERTGIPPEDIKPEIKLNYYAPFTQIYYINGVTFRTLDLPEGSISDSSQFIGDIQYRRLFSPAIIKFIAIAQYGDVMKAASGDDQFRIFNLPVSDIADIDESPFDYINERMYVSYDYSRLYDDDYEMIFSQNGLLQVIRCGRDLRELLEKYVLIEGNIHQEMFFPRNVGRNNFYEDVYKLLIVKEDRVESEPLINQTICNAFHQYMALERKSLFAHKVIRPIKQIAYDCISNKARNIAGPEHNYSSRCDYEECEYKCSSEVLGLKPDENISVPEEVFWDNSEIIYSKPFIDECVKRIMGFFESKMEVSLEKIFKELHRDFREFFISSAIHRLLTENISKLDRFGFPLIVCANKTHLFLRRDPAARYTDCLHYDSIYQIDGIISDPQLVTKDVDDRLIEMIEQLPLNDDYSLMNEEALEAKMFMDLSGYISRFVNYESNAKLLERCYRRLILEKFGEPGVKHLPVDQMVVESYYGKYIYPLQLENGKLYVHVLSRDPPVQSGKKNTIQQKHLKNFRYFNIDSKQWETPTDKDFIKNVIEDLKSEVAKTNKPDPIWIKLDGYPDDGNPNHITQVVPIYYMIHDDGDDKLVSNDKKRGSTGMNMKSVNESMMTKAVNYFEEYLAFSVYPQNVYDLIHRYQHERISGSKKNVLSNTFKDLCIALNIYKTLDTEVQQLG